MAEIDEITKLDHLTFTINGFKIHIISKCRSKELISEINEEMDSLKYTAEDLYSEESG